MTKLLLRLGLVCLLFFAYTSRGFAVKHDEKADTSKKEAAKIGLAAKSGEVEPSADKTLTGPLMELAQPDKEDPENPFPAPQKEEPTINKFVKWTLIAVSLLFLIVILSLFNVIGLMGDVSGKPAIDWNKWNPRLMVLFLIAFLSAGVYEAIADSDYYMPESASEHGVGIDNMFSLTTVLILIVFFITQAALFIFPYKYRMRKGHTAYFYSHNDRLEIIWTVIPAIALSILITGGLKSWNSITSPAPTDAQHIEVYAKQFGWTARYEGKDMKLGKHNFRLIKDDNDLGIDWSDAKSHDDVQNNSEIHLIKGKNVEFKFRAKDVIHSAYMPYFRLQMNVVPGVPTSFWMKPILTTLEMRNVLRANGRPDANDFEYYLYCNKICGSAHYNMKIKVVVEDEESYNKWWATQKADYVKMNEPEAPAAATPASVPATPTDTSKKDKAVAMISNKK
ncbi:MAG: cytochrome c oxidase subunit II [Bacteroidota bacterium]|nr:cytochrome c oxidase subunit II [Bacteroidota bacterium]